jgi:hypothetical protein
VKLRLRMQKLQRPFRIAVIEGVVDLPDHMCFLL